MVRTKDLGRALGRVTGRGLGREDHDDSDDAPQRKRHTASDGSLLVGLLWRLDL